MRTRESRIHRNTIVRIPGAGPGHASSSAKCVHKSGGDSACLLLHDLRFGAEPVVQRMAVFPAADFVEFLRAEADLVFEFLWFACHGRWRFLRGICIHGGNSLEANVRLN